MRIMIKGGVWKNTEDEILKAAVMKYGLNQWARISSLLVRKTPKQCKARWFEWLDPSIKKTEWTREEDEKLLHLAKLMPCQWRTIAPIVGRTAAQCLERYEKLLDMANRKDDKFDAHDDPRRLRPGEIDPNPESKPARPDPVDMDEDEKEMLSEARARLANTRGKKAKRKSREKQMEEARRLASLQKKRELKAAGIEVRERKPRRGAIDYSAEVAFEKQPAAGFFDTSKEGRLTKEMQQEFRPVTIEELEGRRKRDVEEDLIKQDIKKARLAASKDLPSAVAKAAELNDPLMVHRRPKLMLPAPQVSEAELEYIAQASQQGRSQFEAGAGGEATQQLLGDYGPAPAANIRTLRTAPTGDCILQEARQQALLRDLQTPLMGQSMPEGFDVNQMDFSGATPAPQVAATPNPLAAAATPGRIPGATPAIGAAGATGRIHGAGSYAIAGVSATPSIAGTPARPGATPAWPGMTPMRDQLGINEMDALDAAGASKRAQRQMELERKSEIRSKLASLPKPQHAVELELPELPEEPQAEEGMVEDAADVKARRQREEEQRRQEEERKKSRALQRGLPRPQTWDTVPVRPDAELAGLRLLDRAEALVAAELVRMLSHDAAKYPVKDKSKKDKKAAKAVGPVMPLEEFDAELLAAASQLLQQEIQFVRHAFRQDTVTPEEEFEVWQAISRDLLFVPSKNTYERAATAGVAERVEAARAEFERVKAEIESERKRIEKLTSKVDLVLGGLRQRDKELTKKLDELYRQCVTETEQLTCFKALHEQEQRAAPDRLDALQQLVAAQQERERALQERYKAACRRRDDLREELAQAAA